LESYLFGARFADPFSFKNFFWRIAAISVSTEAAAAAMSSASGLLLTLFVEETTPLGPRFKKTSITLKYKERDSSNKSTVGKIWRVALILREDCEI
jgi:hypothetical protein